MKTKKIAIVCIFIMLCTCFLPIDATTYFDGKSIQVEKMEKWDILSNEVTIDTVNSSVKYVFLLQNTTNTSIEQEVNIQLENTTLATKVEDVSIVVNQANVQYKKSEEGIYTFKIKAEANAVKKIEIQYKTENNLKDAKVIKYSLDNLMGKKIKALKVDIHIQEEDIPLVKAIYPYNYTFENNTISVRYYDFTVNHLTKDIIVEKDTYKDLLYGREYTFSDAEEYIIKNAKDWIKNGIALDYEKDVSGDDNRIDADAVIFRISGLESNIWHKKSVCSEIAYYSIMKQLEKDGKNDTLQYFSVERPLVKDYIHSKNYKNEEKMQEWGKMANLYEENLVGKVICIDYVESEGDKALYVNKRVNGWEKSSEETVELEEVQVSEWEILKAPVSWDEICAEARVIYVGMDIEGNKIEATEKEKIEYVNSMNADMYVRVMIYDGDITIPQRNSENVIIGLTSEVERCYCLL